MGSALGRVVIEHTQGDPQPGRGSTPQGSRSCATGRASTPQRSRFRSRIPLIWGVAGNSMGQELLLAPAGLSGEPASLRPRSSCAGSSPGHTPPRGTPIPPRLGATPRTSRQPAWPRWVRHRAVESLATAAPKGTDTRGFFGNPPEKDDAGVRVGEDSEEGLCGCWPGRRWGDRVDGQNPGGDRGGGRMSRWVGDTCPRPGLLTNVERVSQVFIKMPNPILGGW